MCGIAGFFGLAVGDTEARAVVDLMCERIRHRGPDGDGVAIADGVALGMVRLAIVDVAHGQQPMFSDDGSIALVFNGEIYNAPALRLELEREGVRFNTRSDTEVILRLYERNADDVERHLRGMWAFAVHDRRRMRLTLSRDRFGIKPLYICHRGRAFAFASELNALAPVRRFPQLSPAFAIDTGAAHAMLSWAYIPNDDTIYAGVKKLAPSTRVELDLRSNVAHTKRYYRIQSSTEAARARSLGEACELIEPLLKAAVKEHLESDVPIASFLSGGIDSSLVLAYAAEQSSKPITAFTIGFRERRYDESPFARRVAEILGVRLHVELLDQHTARAALDEAMGSYDEPFGDASSLATYLLAKTVSKTHKVALGGDGGDEIFAGYKKHRIIRFREAFAHAPAARELAAKMLERLPARTDRTNAIADGLRVARRVGRSLHGDDAHAYLALTQVAPLDTTARLLRNATSDHERFEGPILETFAAAGGSQLHRTLASDLANVLPNDMLVKVDRATMACSIEARVPLLDHRIVEAGLSLPQPLTLGWSGKRVLKALYARRFGTELARRKKTGFGVPVEEWMRGPLATECDSTFDASRNPRSLLARDLGGGGWRTWAERNGQLLWHAFALGRWSATHDE